MLRTIAFIFGSTPISTSAVTQYVEEEMCPISHTPVAELENPYRASDGRLYEAEYLSTWLRKIPDNPASPLTKGSMKSDYEKLVGPLPEPSVDKLIEGIEPPQRREPAKLLLVINQSFQQAFVLALRPVFGQQIVGLSRYLFMPALKGNKNINLANAVMLGVGAGVASLVEKKYMFPNSSMFGAVNPLALGWAGGARHTTASVALFIAINKAVLQGLLNS